MGGPNGNLWDCMNLWRKPQYAMLHYGSTHLRYCPALDVSTANRGGGRLADGTIRRTVVRNRPSAMCIGARRWSSQGNEGMSPWI